MKQTKISDVAADEAAQAAERKSSAKGKTPMSEIEKAHGTAPVDPGAAKHKASKARIDTAAFGVPDGTPPAEPVEKKPRKPAAE